MLLYSISGIFFVCAVGLDLYLAKSAKVKTSKSAVLESLFWIALALGYAGCIRWFWPATSDQQTPATDFLTSYLLERLLSIDNILVFIWIFDQLALEDAMRHRVLVFGIYGALLMRFLVLAGGLSILSRFHWILYGFGLLLIASGFKMARASTTSDKGDWEKTLVHKWLIRHLPLALENRSHRFWIRSGGSFRGTKGLLALVSLIIADLVFAIDSVPAVLAVTREPVLVYMSNFLALLGLRPIYLLLTNSSKHYRFLNKCLALTLILIGIKLLLTKHLHLTSLQLISMIAALFGGGLIWHWARSRWCRDIHRRDHCI